MCDVEEKILPWLDGELPATAAAGVARHIETCAECRNRLSTYRVVDQSFKVCCEALIAAKTRRGVPRWVPALATAAVVAGVLFLFFPRTRIAPPPVLTPSVPSASAVVPVRASAPAATEAAPRKTIRKRPVTVPRVQKEPVMWRPEESAVQIAIPADAMFAPGALPKGMNFVAELSIAPDGSVKQVRLLQ